MDCLQTLACYSFLTNSVVGTEIPCDIPGTLRAWVRAWAGCVGLDKNADVLEMVHECIERGSSSRLCVSRAFTGKVDALADTLGIHYTTCRCEGDNKASGFHDTTIRTASGWTWRVKSFELIRQRIRAGEKKEAEFQRRYPVVKKEVIETLGDIRRCEDWEDRLEYILWGEIRSSIDLLPRGMRKKCVARL
ncbi:unnamed protein product, partial [Ectocarpus sp. 12 AP-2014]